MTKTSATVLAACTLATLLPHPALAACWRVLPGSSKIVFQVTQAGGSLQGAFKSASGSVCIDNDKPTASRVTVSVAMASVATALPKLDQALRGPDFFDASRWPRAVFTGTKVRARGGDRYEVTGTLRLRNVSRKISVRFTFHPGAGGQSAHLATRFALNRLDYGIGRGQWADTRWVGNRVTVNVSATLVRQ